MIAHQGKFAEGLDWWNDQVDPSDPWAAHGVHNHAVMIAGFDLEAGELTDTNEFVEASVGDVRTDIENWLAADVYPVSPWFDPATFTGFVILDIEHPVHPREFRDWFVDDDEPSTNHVPSTHADYAEDINGDPVLFDHIIHGFRTRIAAARDIFPLAKLAVYPMVLPNSNGTCNTNTELNIAAWTYASSVVPGVPMYDNNMEERTRQSWLDELDNVCVQLYPRWAPCDGGPTDDPPYTTKYNETTTKNYVNQGLAIAKNLADMETGVGVLPMLAFNIHNSEEDPEASCEADMAATVEYVRWQLEEIRDYAFACTPGYTAEDFAICWWDGDGVLEDPRVGGPQTIAEFMDELCFFDCELNGNTTYNYNTTPPSCILDFDDAMWSQAVHDALNLPSNPFHMVLDNNGDRLVTTSGADNDEDHCVS